MCHCHARGRIAMRIDSCRRFVRSRLARSSVWFGIFLATAANAQTYRQKVSAEYVIAPDLSLTYTVHSETTPPTQSALNGASQTRYSVNSHQTFEEPHACTLQMH